MKWAEALRLMTSNSSAPSPLSIFLATPIDEVLDDRDVHRGRCAGAVPAPQQAVVPVQLDRGVGRLHAQHDDGPLGPVARVVEAEHLGRVFDQLLEPGQGRVLLLAMLVVGDQEREHIASDPPDSRLDARHRIRPDAGGDRDRPRRDVDLLRIALPLSVGPRDRREAVRSSSALVGRARSTGPSGGPCAACEEAASMSHRRGRRRSPARRCTCDGGDAPLAAPNRDDAYAPRTRLHRAGRGRTPRAAHGSRRRAFPPGRGSSSSACSWRCGRSRCCSCRMRCSRCAAVRPRRSTDRRPRRPGCRSRRPPGPC